MWPLQSVWTCCCFLFHAYCPSSYPSAENVQSDLWPEQYLLLTTAAEETLVSTRIKTQGAASLALCVLISDPVLWQAAQNGKKLLCLPNSSSQKVAPASRLPPHFFSLGVWLTVLKCLGLMEPGSFVCVIGFGSLGCFSLVGSHKN